jgi:hypothetical protein
MLFVPHTLLSPLLTMCLSTKRFQIPIQCWPKLAEGTYRVLVSISSVAYVIRTVLVCVSLIHLNFC